MARFLSARSKIERAKEHIVDLDRRIRLFVESEPYEIRAKPHLVPQIQHTTLYISRVGEIPDSVPLVLGDALHNLRTALDHTACELVRANGGVPNEHTYFPICDPAQKLTPAIFNGKVKGMLSAAQVLIRDVQADRTGDRTLWHLHKLDIIDKHRLLLTASVGMKGWGVEEMTAHGYWFERGMTFSLMEGQEIVNIPTSTYNRQKNEDFKLKLEITFGETEVLEGEPILPAVKQMADLIEALVSKFENLVP
jgi:hypothetical protein